MLDGRVLFVDDDPGILESFERNLFEEADLRTALGPQRGLELVRDEGPFSVIVSDLRMPQMDGTEFLRRVREDSPDSVRMLLSGNVDLEAAIAAVNGGQIFRLLTKPCSPEMLLQALEDGVTQYKLVIAEKELLQGTLRGVIKLLNEIFEITDPDAFGRTVQLRDLVHAIGSEMDVENTWEIELAWMLSQIGNVTMPPEIALKKRTGQPLTAKEKEIAEQAPLSVERLLLNIPRMEGIARIIRYTNKHYDGSGVPEDALAHKDIPIGSRILKVVSDMAELRVKDIPVSEAVKRMKRRSGWYDFSVLRVAAKAAGAKGDAALAKVPPVEVGVRGLEVGDIVMSEICSRTGSLILPRGAVLELLHIERIKNFHKMSGVEEPIRVERKRASTAP